MSEGERPRLGRRRMLRTLAATGVATTLAGCSGGYGDGNQTDSDGGDAGDATSNGDSSTTDSGGTEDATATMADDGSAGDDGTTTDDDGGGLSKDDDDSGTDDELTGGDGPVTATVRLNIRDVKSNVDEFETLRATFERFELEATDGSTVTLDDETRDVDLTEIGEGGTVDLFETEIPAGAYETGTLYLPIQEATLADGSDPEFQDTVPTSRSVRDDAIDIGGGDAVAFDVRLGLVRVGGDGAWTYNLGWGIAPA